MERLLGQMPPSFSPSTGVAENVVQVKVQKSSTVATNIEESIWSAMDYDDEAIKLILISGNSRIKTREEIDAIPHLEEKSQFYHQHDQKFVSIEDSNNGIPVKSSRMDVSSNNDCVNIPETKQTMTCYRSQSRQPISRLNQSLSKIMHASPIQILKEALKKRDLTGLQQYFKKAWSLYLTNTGGQIEFQEVLPLLVSGPSAFFFTFRLDRDLNECYEIEYQLPDKMLSKPYMTTLTTLEGIMQTLASISAMGTFVYHSVQAREVSLQPKVFFIGTHKDKIDSQLLNNRIAYVDQQLQDAIKPTAHYQNIVEFASPDQLIFTVNNFSEDDSDFQRIRNAVERVVE